MDKVYVYTNVIKLLATETAKNNFLKIKLLYMRWKKVNLENLKIVREERREKMRYIVYVYDTHHIYIYNIYTSIIINKNIERFLFYYIRV
jgi:hypothetical protein